MTDPLDRALRELGSPDNVRLRAHEIYQQASRGRRRFVIAGSGHLGRVALVGARRAGLDVLAFADNNRKLAGDTIDGVPRC